MNIDRLMGAGLENDYTETMYKFSFFCFKAKLSWFLLHKSLQDWLLSMQQNCFSWANNKFTND